MMKHTQQLERIADSLEHIERSLTRLAAVAERVEHTVVRPVRILQTLIFGR